MKDYGKNVNVSDWLGGMSEYSQELDGLAFLLARNLNREDRKNGIPKPEHRKNK